jgi:hypothetical protein
MRDVRTEVGRYVVASSAGFLDSHPCEAFLEPASATASNTSMATPIPH